MPGDEKSGFFGLSSCYEGPSKFGGPLEKINAIIDFKAFGNFRDFKNEVLKVFNSCGRAYSNTINKKQKIPCIYIILHLLQTNNLKDLLW